MFGLGLKEIIVILIVALLVFGPQQLPELARTLGKTLGGFRRALDEIKRETNFTGFDLDEEEKPATRNTETGAVRVHTQDSGSQASTQEHEAKSEQSAQGSQEIKS